MALRQEIWHQDPFEKDLWVGENGLLVNAVALEERAYYAEVVRMPAQPIPVSNHEPEGEFVI